MEILWIAGQAGSGKTTLAKRLIRGQNAILLDGDAMRSSIGEDLGFTESDRRTNNIRIAKLAMELQSQGYEVVVATVCPSWTLRREIYELTKCRFILLEGGSDKMGRPFEWCGHNRANK